MWRLFAEIELVLLELLEILLLLKGDIGAVEDYQCEKFYYMAVKKEELKRHLEVFQRDPDYQ